MRKVIIILSVVFIVVMIAMPAIAGKKLDVNGGFSSGAPIDDKEGYGDYAYLTLGHFLTDKAGVNFGISLSIDGCQGKSVNGYKYSGWGATLGPAVKVKTYKSGKLKSQVTTALRFGVQKSEGSFQGGTAEKQNTKVAVFSVSVDQYYVYPTKYWVSAVVDIGSESSTNSTILDKSRVDVGWKMFVRETDVIKFGPTIRASYASMDSSSKIGAGIAFASKDSGFTAEFLYSEISGSDFSDKDGGYGSMIFSIAL